LKKKKFKVVRIFSRLNIGGPSYHVINLADRLQDYSCETTLVVGRTSEWEGNLISYAKTKKIQPIFINSFLAQISPLNDLISFFRILVLLLKIKPDIVHTHTFKAGLIGRIAAWISGVPILIHTYHGHLLNNYWSGWKLWILKTIESSLSKISDRCISVSTQVSQDLVLAGVVPEYKMKTVSLGFDFSYLKNELESDSTLRKKLQIPPDHFVFGTACRLVPIKNIQLLVEASVKCLTEFQNSHLVIVGQGPEKKNLIALAQALTQNEPNLLKRIHFMDWIVPFQRELKDFNFYVCCSKNEGTSVSVIEALIAQVPVVSTAVGGMPDLLNSGEYGELITPGSVDELSNAICKKILKFNDRSNLKETSNLEKISKEVSNLYSESHLAKNTFDIYRECLIEKGQLQP
jgi:glycosyltransferase involved in cell wall biosynthesis